MMSFSKQVLLPLFASLSLFASCEVVGKEHFAYNEGINIIPKPLSIEKIGGGNLLLSRNTSFVAQEDELQEIAKFFSEKISASTGFTIQVKSESSNPKQEIAFNLVTTDQVSNEEGYKLNVSEDNGVVIEASNLKGVFWAMQTLLQLLPAEIESSTVVKNVEWAIPYISIVDEPRFSYRGLHLDPCRHWIPVEDVKRHLDVMSMLKINKLHWHLTEDQGWRIEIKAYPELTEVGSKRIEGDGSTYGPYFYTQEEVKDIVAYARTRGITVIPEIEFPGHNVGVLTAYPELGCHGADYPYEVRNIWGVSEEVLCAGNDKVFEFASNVLSEVVTLFDSEYIHIGGDEAPKNSWKRCPKCQERIRAEKLKDEYELQSYFIKRIEQIILSHGRKMIGWEEILEGGLAESAIVMSWTGEQGGITAANMGNEIIMTPSSRGLYLDHYQGDPGIEPQAICCYSTLDRVYAYEPIPEGIPVEKHDLLLGVQANVWGEYLYEPWLYEYMAYPREVAVAEVAWSQSDAKDYNDFLRRLNNFQVRMDKHNVNYYIPQPEQPGGSINHVAFVDEETTLEFTTNTPVYKIIYTTDGSDPTVDNSMEYTAPISFTKTTDLKIRTLTMGGRMSPVRQIKVEKTEYAPALAQVTDEDFAQKYTQGVKVEKVEDRYFGSTDELLVARADATQSYLVEFSKAKEPFYQEEKLEHHMSNVNHFGALISGYILVPEDAVYRLSALHHKVWIDDQLVINNEDGVKKQARNDVTLALATGLHKVQISYIGVIDGGWPTQWNDVRLKMSKFGEKLTFVPDTLFYRDI